jgi:hypothetical protein
MPVEINEILLLSVIALLFIWLIYRFRYGVRRMIKTEIFNNFPAIKDTIDNFECRVEYLKVEIELLENKIKEIKNKASA